MSYEYCTDCETADEDEICATCGRDAIGIRVDRTIAKLEDMLREAAEGEFDGLS